MYIRFQSPYPGKRGVHTGVFGLTNLLGRDGHLTAEEHADWRAGNDWDDVQIVVVPHDTADLNRSSIHVSGVAT